MRKKQKTLFLYAFILVVGCSSKNNIKDLTKLSNDELCIYMGENNKDGPLSLKIIDEIKSRENISSERCYMLEHKAIEGNVDGVSIEPYATPEIMESVYDKNKGRYIIKNTGPTVGAKIKF
ncbi:hypothetical protein [Xenorhabdus budapestensis]|uniref:Lipoprotein n=1 Tax=Xenorhabdus budapestensis TaxID=290110 RepID=A0A2D0J1U5_XENBU|nr:hypothetical protein [Xenorhabdus budapestensis]PHM28241.1 hypothetical protein Xbud_01638 [Xenorhabdus budapestensis]QTL40462.1 hypothetical protein HGO23_03430 [Xenorhabdus budapestensis]